MCTYKSRGLQDVVEPHFATIHVLDVCFALIVTTKMIALLQVQVVALPVAPQKYPKEAYSRLDHDGEQGVGLKFEARSARVGKN